MGGAAAVVVQQATPVGGCDAGQCVHQALHTLLDRECCSAAAHIGLRPARVQCDQGGTGPGGLCGGDHHVECGFADAVEPGVTVSLADQRHLAGQEGKHTTFVVQQRGHLRQCLHGPQHVGVHDAVELLAVRWCAGAVCVPQARDVQRERNLFAVELPGQPADAGRVGHVHGKGLGTQRLHAGATCVVAHGGDHAVARLAVLAHQLKANTPGRADHKNSVHFLRKIGL